MIAAVSNTRHLVIPMPENPLTLWSESLRRYPPRPAFPNESAVLAMHLDPAQDLDGDGFADADNDRDGAIDEDPGGDSNFDLAPGLVGIDDDNDGFVDEQHLLIFPGSLSLGPLNEDDDEDNYANEDLIDGIDNDGDGKFDEDIKKQTDGNDLPGVGGVDDDGDGLIDEGDKNDDDEDGSIDEDWYDTLVFYLNGNRLMERRPVPWDTNLDGFVTGLDFIETLIAENVLELRFERIPAGSAVEPILKIKLIMFQPGSDEQIVLNTSLRIGRSK